MNIRPAVLEDVTQIAAVHILGWQDEYRDLLPRAVLNRLSEPDPMSRWYAMVQQSEWPGRGVLVADRGGTVAGFATIRPTSDQDQDPGRVGEIAALYVHPRAWRRGVGRSLVAAATGRLAAAGRVSATLWVLETNSRAIALYEAGGFVPDGAVKPGFVSGVTTHNVRYQRPLVHPGPR